LLFSQIRFSSGLSRRTCSHDQKLKKYFYNNDKNARLRNVLSLTFLGVFMLSWALAFLVIAIIAAIFGFGGIAATATGIAKILFYIFIILFLISLLFGLLGGGSPTPPL